MHLQKNNAGTAQKCKGVQSVWCVWQRVAAKKRRPNLCQIFVTGRAHRTAKGGPPAKRQTHVIAKKIQTAARKASKKLKIGRGVQK